MSEAREPEYENYQDSLNWTECTYCSEKVSEQFVHESKVTGEPFCDYDCRKQHELQQAK